MKLSGQVALITGAASGIGKAQALLFAKEDAYVVAVDKQEDELKKTADEIKSFKGNAITVCADISVEDEVIMVREKALEKYGFISILCNTAGIYDNLMPLQNMDLAVLRKIISVNIEGTFLMTKYVTENMVENKYGVLVNMASDAGLIGGGGGVAYTMSKHAIIGLTKQINAELGHAGIRANAIAPGLIHTPMVQDFLGEGSPVLETFKKIPAARGGTPKDIAQVSLFLASEDSAYIYGETVSVDGGLISTLRL